MKKLPEIQNNIWQATKKSRTLQFRKYTYGVN